MVTTPIPIILLPIFTIKLPILTVPLLPVAIMHSPNSSLQPTALPYTVQ